MALVMGGGGGYNELVARLEGDNGSGRGGQKLVKFIVQW